MYDPTHFSIAKWLLAPALIFGRYFMMCLVAFVVFYTWNRRTWIAHKIQQKFPKKSDYYREIGFSAITSVIFAGMAWLWLGTPLRRFTQFYADIDQYGWVYLIASIGIALLLHDTYFYWAHRLMHHPRLYRRFHLLHHKSVNPSPWAAYAFHPLEAIVEAGILPILLIVLPMHPLAFFGFITAMLVFNVYGHLGYELFPRHIYAHPLGKWLNTSIYHNLHHERVQGNYSLYFTFWDRWCNTLRTDSAAKIDEVHARQRVAHL